MVYELSLLGLKDDKMMECFGVTKACFNWWKKNIEEFRASYVSGKDIADAKVAKALFERACGYSHEETRVHFDKFGAVSEHTVMKHYPPDTAAATNWLKLRQKENWKDNDAIDLNLHHSKLKPLSSLFDDAPEEAPDAETE